MQVRHHLRNFSKNKNKMKKIISLAIALTISFSLFAQEEHLTFKNIPITGSLSSFISKMKASDFDLVEQIENSGAIMIGSFAGFSDCTILIGCSPKTKTVWKVVVELPDQTSWTSVKSRYSDFKEKFKKKYGAPEKSYEFFTTPYYEGDGYELQAIKLEKGYYYTFWETDLGLISVSVDASSSSKGRVEFNYEDNASRAIMRNERSSIVDDDI